MPDTPEEADHPIAIERIATFIGSARFNDELQFFTALLGAPTFVQPETWAQFDNAGTRICLAGGDENVAHSALMLKVADLSATATALGAMGCEVGDVQRGAHEDRLMATTAHGRTIIAYCPI